VRSLVNRFVSRYGFVLAVIALALSAAIFGMLNVSMFIAG
jgi:hypothetical protein